MEPLITWSTANPVREAPECKRKDLLALNVVAEATTSDPKFCGFLINAICLKSWPTVKSPPSEPESWVLIATKKAPNSEIGSVPWPLGGEMTALAVHSYTNWVISMQI